MDFKAEARQSLLFRSRQPGIFVVGLGGLCDHYDALPDVSRSDTKDAVLFISGLREKQGCCVTHLNIM